MDFSHAGSRMEYFRSRSLGDCRMFVGDDGVFMLQPDTGATLLAGSDLSMRIVRDECGPELEALLRARGFRIAGSPSDACRACAPDPVFFLIDFTRRCTNRCAYCFRRLHASQRMDAELLGRIVRAMIAHCRRNGLRTISFQAWGGEPLLEWDAVKTAQDAFRHAGIEPRILIETNGVPVTRRIAREMYERGILCSVSLDGPADLHDRNRTLAGGGGTHEYALGGFRRLQDAGYGNRIGAVCVVTRPSLRHLERMVGYFSGELSLQRIKMNVVKDSPALADKTLCLSDDSVGEFWRELLARIVAVNERGVVFGENTILAMLHNLTTRRPVSFCHSRGCQGGMRMVSFGMDAGIYPCDMTDRPELCLGEVDPQTDFCATIRERMDGNPFLTLTRPKSCDACAWRTYCGGGCSSMRLARGGAEPDAADCARNRTLYPLLIDLILHKPHIVSTMSSGEITIA